MAIDNQSSVHMICYVSLVHNRNLDSPIYVVAQKYLRWTLNTDRAHLKYFYISLLSKKFFLKHYNYKVHLAVPDGSSVVAHSLWRMHTYSTPEEEKELDSGSVGTWVCASPLFFGSGELARLFVFVLGPFSFKMKKSLSMFCITKGERGREREKTRTRLTDVRPDRTLHYFREIA